MATKSKVADRSFRVGCGRYIQENGAISHLKEEMARLGCTHPFILAGENAWRAAGEKIEAALAGTEPVFETFSGYCVSARCEAITAREDVRTADLVIGVGGGILMDAAKLCAIMLRLPVLLIPTSSATCAACAPLSVTYDEIGRPCGTRHHDREVNCVLADMDILAAQPVRLFVSGVYDAMAKVMETRQRIEGREESEVDIGLRSSYELSKFSFERLNADFDTAVQALEKHEGTKELFDSIYISLCLTGVISGLARGSNQTAIAHKIYESARALYPTEAVKALHGELVAVGLIAQLAYYGETEQAEAFRQGMKHKHLPTSFAEWGIPSGDEVREAIYQKMLLSSAMAGTTAEEHARLRSALQWII